MREQRGLLARLGSLGRWLLLAILVGAAGLVVCRHLIQAQLDEQIRVYVQAALADHYSDLDVRVRAARRIEGKGIEIRGVSLRSSRDGSSAHELAHVDEVFASCKADLGELLSGNLCVQQLVVRRMKIQAICEQDGQWDVAGLFPLPKSGDSRPLVVIEDSTIEFRDVNNPGGVGWALRDIDIVLRPNVQRDELIQFEFAGNMLGDHFKRVKVKGIVDPSGNWSAGGTIDGLEMSQRMLNALPADVAGQLSFLATLRVRAHFEFQLGHRQGDPEPVRWILRGHLTEGSVDDPRLPLPLTDLDAEVFCDNRQLKIENVTARSGPSSLQLSCCYDGFLSDSPQLELSAKIGQLALDQRLYNVLPVRIRDEWDKFAPAGLVDAVVDLGTVDGKIQTDFQVTCRDVSFAYHKFPLRFQHAKGLIRLRDDILRVTEFTAQAGGQTIHMAAEFQNPGPLSTGWFTMRSTGPLPLDDNLISAMTPNGQRIARMLHPTGAMSLASGRFERQVPGGPKHERWELELHGCSIVYDIFPVPIDKITGKLILVDRRWEFRDLRGYHGSGYIVCNGGWLPAPNGREGGDLTLDLKCSDVPLDDALRNAVGRMSAGAERFWTSLRPRGTIDRLDAVVRYDSQTKRTNLSLFGEKWAPEQNVEGRSISVHPRWLPMRFDDVTGSVSYTDGEFKLHKVCAMRGDSPVELAGQGRVGQDQRWDVRLTRLIADRLRVDHVFVEALPEGLQAAVRQFEYRGMLSISGNTWLSGGEGLAIDAGWDVLLDIEDGAIDNKLKLEHVHGGVRLIGEKNSKGFHSRGELEIDSLMTRGVQVTQIQGPIWFDALQLILGSRADVGRRDQPPRQIIARAFGGEITMDGHVILDDRLQFAADVALSGGDLESVVRSTAPQPHDVSGTVFALLHVTGARAGTHTLKGHGQIRLRDADICELPLMVELLSVLTLQQPDRTAFTSSDIDFRLGGEEVYLDRIDFLGDAISLKGKGWADLNRRINLDFYALVGRHEIKLPLVRTFLAEASRKILLIQVVGTVDQPNVIRKPLPELDETLQRIFPEAAPHEANPKLPWFLGRAKKTTR